MSKYLILFETVVWFCGIEFIWLIPNLKRTHCWIHLFRNILSTPVFWAGTSSRAGQTQRQVKAGGPSYKESRVQGPSSGPGPEASGGGVLPESGSEPGCAGMSLLGTGPWAYQGWGAIAQKWNKMKTEPFLKRLNGSCALGQNVTLNKAEQIPTWPGREKKRGGDWGPQSPSRVHSQGSKGLPLSPSS